MNYVQYVVLNDGLRVRVTHDDCDAVEQAGIIDRTLLPVLATGQGWADSRKSGYTVTGQIKSNSASLQLLDAGVPVATLAVCLKAKASAAMWEWIKAHAVTPLLDTGEAPPPAWAALRYDVPEAALPSWLDWWAKHVAFALLTREGW